MFLKNCHKIIVYYFIFFLLDDGIDYSIKSVKDKNNMAEVTLKNLRKNREYVILETNKNFSVESGIYTIELQRCMRYTVSVKNCTDMYLSVPPGRYRRGLVVLGGFFLSCSHPAFLGVLVYSCLFSETQTGFHVSCLVCKIF